MATAPQTHHNDGFAPFSGVDGTGRAACNRTNDGPALGVAVVNRLAQQRARSGTQNSRPKGLLVELFRQRLAGCKIGLEGCGGLFV